VQAELEAPRSAGISRDGLLALRAVGTISKAARAGRHPHLRGEAIGDEEKTSRHRFVAGHDRAGGPAAPRE